MTKRNGTQGLASYYKPAFNSFTGEGAIMRRARATFCGRRRNIATTYGCVPYSEATVRYGREKCQDTTLRPRVPPLDLSNVPDRRELRERRRLRRVARRRPSRALRRNRLRPPCRHSMSLARVAGHCQPMQLSTLSPLAHTFVSPPIIYHCTYHIMPQLTEA